MTIRHFRIFIEVATAGKMCDAAENLFISQPTVSQAIKELEDYYNILLFERLGRKLHITEAGKQLLFTATNLLQDFDQLEKQLFESSIHKKMNIGSTITIGNCILPDVINDLKDAHPNVITYSQIANTEEIEKHILDSTLDIGIIEGNINNPNFITIPVLKDQLVLACGMGHRFSKLNKITINDIKNEDFIMREIGSGTRKLFEDYIDKYEVPINVVLQSNCPGSIKNAILKNNYLSVISYRLIEDEVRNGEMCFFECSKKSWDRSFKIVYHKDKYLDETLKALIEVTENFDKKYSKEKLKGRTLIR